MHVLIFGRNGQVARELGRVAWPAGITIQQLDRTECDLAIPAAAGGKVLETRPDVVINAAAHTAVDRAESEPAIAGAINRDSPSAMADACRAIGAKFIHLSTDYVFDGEKRVPYVEDDPVAPLSVYGRTKEAGEAAVRSLAPEHIILRTSWVFAAHGSNFVRTMLRLAKERTELRIVVDQRGAPTGARDIARAVAAIVERIAAGNRFWGTFHFTSSEPTTWFGFAETIFAALGAAPGLVPTTTEEYKTPARRPLYSVLNCARVRESFGIAQPCWRAALSDVMAELAQEACKKGAVAE